MTDRASPSGPFLSRGTTTLVAGTKTVTQKVPPSSQIVLTRTYPTAPPTTTNWGSLGVLVAADRLSFTITSSNALDTSDVAWTIL